MVAGWVGRRVIRGRRRRHGRRRTIRRESRCSPRGGVMQEEVGPAADLVALERAIAALGAVRPTVPLRLWAAVHPRGFDPTGPIRAVGDAPTPPTRTPPKPARPRQGDIMPPTEQP